MIDRYFEVVYRIFDPEIGVKLYRGIVTFSRESAEEEARPIMESLRKTFEAEVTIDDLVEVNSAIF